MGRLEIVSSLVRTSGGGTISFILWIGASGIEHGLHRRQVKKWNRFRWQAMNKPINTIIYVEDADEIDALIYIFEALETRRGWRTYPLTPANKRRIESVKGRELNILGSYRLPRKTKSWEA